MEFPSGGAPPLVEALAPPTVVIPVVSGVCSIEVSVLTDILRRGAVRVILASCSCSGVVCDDSSSSFSNLKPPTSKNKTITCTRGLKITADTTIEEAIAEGGRSPFAAVAVPGGMPGAAKLANCKTLVNELVRRHKNKALVAAQCAAPAVVLAPLGILDGAELACVSPAFEDQLPQGVSVPLKPLNRQQREDIENPVPEHIREAYLKLQPPREKEDVHFDEKTNVLTARGVGAVTEYAFKLLSLVKGEHVAAEVKFAMAGWDASPDGKVPCMARYYRPGARDPRGIYDADDEEFRNPDCSVLVPLAYGSDVANAVVLVDLLRRANAEVVLASIEATREIVGVRDLRVTADCDIESCTSRTWDAVICPGGQPGTSRLASNRHVVDLLTQQRDSMRMHGAMDEGGAVILAPNGLLDRRVVVYDSGESDPRYDAIVAEEGEVDPSMVPYGRLRRRFGTPSDGPVRVSCNRAYAHAVPKALKHETKYDPSEFLVTVDGPCVTCRGAGCAFEMACTVASYVLCHDGVDETSWMDRVLSDLTCPRHMAFFA